MLNLRVKCVVSRLIVSTFLFLLLSHRAFALEGSFGLQGGVVQAFQDDGKTLDPNFGINGYASLDFKLCPSFSLGLASGLTSLIDNTKRIYVDGTLLTGRWSPWSPSDWTPYLMTGAGLRPFRDSDPKHRWWPGDFQATAGVGVRHPVMKSMELDVTAFYDYNPQASDVLHSLGIRAGVAFPFTIGSGSSKSVKANPEQGASSAPATTDQQTMSGYKVQKGDSLWGISRENYGVGHEWKKIYDANGKEITDPSLIYPAQQIVIPGASGQGPATQAK
jgi:hypothetical protein